MGKQRYKKIQGGRLVREVLWSASYPSDTPKARAEKSKCSTAARKKINQKCAWKKLSMLLAANFCSSDLVVTLTYDDDHLPANAAAAKTCARKFIKQLRAHRKAREQELLYVYNIEGKHGDHRLHHHFVINGTGDDFDVIRGLWTYGADITIERLDEYGYTELAKYLTKEAREDGCPVGARSWIPSLNLAKPEEHPTEWVAEGLRLDPPANAYVLEREELCNEFGRFIYIEYLLPEPPAAHITRPKARRKK